MIFYPIKTLVDAGIDEILIVTSGPHVGHFLGVLKNGTELGIRKLSYAYQEKPDGGIADALSLAEDFSDGQPIAVILGDNVFDISIAKEVREFNSGAHLFVKEVEDPQRFGVIAVDENGYCLGIEEKPKEPTSNYAVTGIYIYDSKVFEYIKRCKPSGRGELEITDVNNFYFGDASVKFTILDGWWSDAGTFGSLLKAANYWEKKHEQTTKMQEMSQ